MGRCDSKRRIVKCFPLLTASFPHMVILAHIVQVKQSCVGCKTAIKYINLLISRNLKCGGQFYSIGVLPYVQELLNIKLSRSHNLIPFVKP